MEQATTTPASDFRLALPPVLENILRTRDAAALEATLATTPLAEREAAFAMQIAACSGWTAGAGMLRAVYPQISPCHDVRRPDRVATILLEFTHPWPSLAIALAGEPATPGTGFSFFRSPRQVVSAAMGLCCQPEREAIWSLLQERCPEAVRDIAGILAPVPLRTQFLKAFAAGCRTGVITVDSLDFLATHVRWPPGATSAFAARFVSRGHPPSPSSQAPASTQATWKDFLARHPERHAAFVQDLRQSARLARLLRAIQAYCLPADQTGWVEWLATTLPRIPSIGRSAAAPGSLHARLVATAASRRLEQPPVQPGRRARRRA